jgi:hypothetical protein
MTGPTAEGGDPGDSASSPIDGLISPVVDEALEFGTGLADVSSASAQVSSGLGSIETRRGALTASLREKITALETEHATNLTGLETERRELEGRLEELRGRKATLTGRVSHWAGRLRVLASEDDAPRGDQLAYAAHVTDGLTPDTLRQFALLDSTVRGNGGETFVAVQRGGGTHTAFGRILAANQGLTINTKKPVPPSKAIASAKSVERVQLPVGVYPTGDDGSQVRPAYGWMSTAFDGDRHDEYSSYDSVLGRSRQEGDSIEDTEGSWAWGRFSLNRGDLHLVHPSRLTVVTAVLGTSALEHALSDESGDYLLTGPAADDYLHAFIGKRLADIREGRWIAASPANVGHEFSRVTSMAARLGVAVNPSRVPHLSAIIGIEF